MSPTRSNLIGWLNLFCWKFVCLEISLIIFEGFLTFSKKLKKKCQLKKLSMEVNKNFYSGENEWGGSPTRRQEGSIV